MKSQPSVMKSKKKTRKAQKKTRKVGSKQRKLSSELTPETTASIFLKELKVNVSKALPLWKRDNDFIESQMKAQMEEERKELGNPREIQ